MCALVSKWPYSLHSEGLKFCFHASSVLLCVTYPVSVTRCDLSEKCKLRSVALCSVCLKFDFRSDYYKNRLPAVGHCEILV